VFVRQPLRLFLFLSFVALSAQAFSQNFDLQRDRMPLAELKGQFRFHAGDDPHYADPSFDDSGWSLLESGQSWYSQGYKNYSGFGWYRFRVTVPASQGSLSLFIPYLSDSYWVYANGRLIGQKDSSPQPRTIYAANQVFAIPASIVPADRTVVFAARVWRSPLMGIYDGAGFDAAPVLGEADAIRNWADLKIHDLFWWNAQEVFMALVNIGAAILGFALFAVRRTEREYMWFGIAQVFWSANTIASLTQVFLKVPYFPNQGAVIVGYFAGTFLDLVFFHVLLRQPRRLLFWIGGVPVLVPIAYFCAVYLGLAGFQNFDQVTAIGYAPYTIAVVLLMFRAGRGGNREAWILFVPFSVSAVATVYNYASWAFGLDRYHAIASVNYFLWNTLSWPILVNHATIIGTACNVAVCAVLVLRFARSRRDEERLSAELEAAREVQQVLIPNEVPVIPGFQIESVYKPASQVGGDFFQIVPLNRGGALIAIGDVSGKGMPAAMTVSLLVGTFRTLVHYTQSPAEILAAMNQRMLTRSQGGFTTCLVLRLNADGTLTAANAGHIAPYIGARELDVANGLPLGLTPDVIYDETTANLTSSERLTLLTDGVIEARNQHGELMGFDRVRELITHPASEIVRRAQRFGQEDDITVLTLSLTPAAVLSA
jgi:sigma-B regulation protein RsbU (phosphoserine phosphatase)